MRASAAELDHRKQRLRDEVLARRYLCRDVHGRVIETPRRLYWRVAKAAGSVDGRHKGVDAQAVSKSFFRMMTHGEFLPNSPTLMNAGRNNGMCLSACFVLPVPDSIAGIFDAVKNTALVQKAGGGTGFSFDQLRPTGVICLGKAHSNPRMPRKNNNENSTCAIRRNALL